ncbi:DUF6264 family protein [Leifsonia shinshuensis]|uniref:DUF6264 family protein n=1 Tax=Leifsonia shinshuensis TaxID=150026 RepID=UPI00285EAB0D|nr:DUF6264 family protein [Leifsonia shinshuensis]MDR6971082.1 hypothetical protein [Leifsonia shinshuensis]
MAEQESQPDDRPRPQYGELAPPGWVWHPPADADRLDTSRPLEREGDGDDAYDRAGAPPSGARVPGLQPPYGQRPDGHPQGVPGAPGQTAGPGQPAPTWNLTLTVLLAVFGFFGMSYSIATLQAIPASMQLLHSTNGLGDYTPAPVVSTLVLVGSILMAVIWVVSAVIAALLLVRRRLAFWVPLVAGIVAMVVLLIFAGAVLATDPVLLGFYSGTTAPGTSSPTQNP